jgi:citrate lyase beta subunit
MTDENVAKARSLLFFPGDDARKCSRALVSAADAVVLDLEDAVHPERKAAARQTIDAYAEATTDALKLVRVNDPTSPEGEADLAQLATQQEIAAIVIPKATLTNIEAASSQSDSPLLALLETAQAIRTCFDIASHPSVYAVALGSADLRAALRLAPMPDGSELLFARSKLVLDSAAAGVTAPIDGPCLTWNTSAVRDEACLARMLGMAGKICIHPAQVEHVNAAFAPAASELEWAQSVLSTWQATQESGRGVSALGSELIDRPVVARAQALIDEARDRELG